MKLVIRTTLDCFQVVANGDPLISRLRDAWRPSQGGLGPHPHGRIQTSIRAPEEVTRVTMIDVTAVIDVKRDGMPLLGFKGGVGSNLNNAVPPVTSDFEIKGSLEGYT